MNTHTRLAGLIATVLCATAIAQAPAATPAAPAATPPATAPAAPRPPRLQFSVTTTAWPDGGEVPAEWRGAIKSPPFEFHWTLGADAVVAPATVRTYAVTLRDMDEANNAQGTGLGNTTVDTFHWGAFNIPGSATGLPEALGKGDLPDGTRNGPGFAQRRGQVPSYVGPGAVLGPFHHYVFEFYALDTRLDLPASATREELLKAMDGHVVGKAAWVGRSHSSATQ